MLKHCSNLFLYLTDQDFVSLCKETVSYKDTVVLENPQGINERVLNKTTITVIAQSDCIPNIPEVLLVRKKSRVWILLEETDDIEVLMNNGFSNFIYDKKDTRQILGCTRYKEGGEVNTKSEVWANNGYEFNFNYNMYKWNDKRVHIRPAEGKHLYEYLVLGKRSQATRQTLCNLRKRISVDFLREFTNV